MQVLSRRETASSWGCDSEVLHWGWLKCWLGIWKGWHSSYFLLLQLPNCIAGMSNYAKPCAKGASSPLQSVIPRITNHHRADSLHCFQQQSCFTLTMLWLIEIYPQEGDDLLCQHHPFLLGQHIPNGAARPVPKGMMETSPSSSLGQLQAGWARKAFNTQRNQHLPGENSSEIPGSTPWPHLGEGGICTWSCVCAQLRFFQKSGSLRNIEPFSQVFKSLLPQVRLVTR